MKKKTRALAYEMDTETVSMDVMVFLDIVEKSAARLRKYVYVVLEHHRTGYRQIVDERIHGVYTTRDGADKKVERLRLDFSARENHPITSLHQYSVLKFRIKGQ